MAITVDEYFRSRRRTEGQNPSIDLIFKCIDDEPETFNDGDVLSAVDAVSPASYDGLLKQNISIDPADWGVWEATVHYGLRKKPEIGDSEIRIDTTGGTHHNTQALDTVGSYGQHSTSPVPDCKNVIGDQGDGNPEGVDIHVPAFNYHLTTVLDPTFVTDAYIQTLFHLTGTVNNAPYRIFAAGECLFLGAVLTRRSTQPWVEAAYSFVGSRNITGLQIGDIKNIVKKGHEYLWVRYQQKEDWVSARIISEPVYAYVQKVYPETDFSLLGV